MSDENERLANATCPIMMNKNMKLTRYLVTQILDETIPFNMARLIFLVDHMTTLKQKINIYNPDLREISLILLIDKEI